MRVQRGCHGWRFGDRCDEVVDEMAGVRAAGRLVARPVVARFRVLSRGLHVRICLGSERSRCAKADGVGEDQQQQKLA